ncbi:MAG: hypothetical protein KME38_30595 [Spirirestis rafaelensis WJT71-NPBG6]|jgi:hypothetical protein|nr:hypothetical protein [Spirirestis rafaelensis WJT71-NPBG6]
MRDCRETRPTQWLPKTLTGSAVAHRREPPWQGEGGRQRGWGVSGFLSD